EGKKNMSIPTILLMQSHDWTLRGALNSRLRTNQCLQIGRSSSSRHERKKGWWKIPRGRGKLLKLLINLPYITVLRLVLGYFARKDLPWAVKNRYLACLAENHRPGELDGSS